MKAFVYWMFMIQISIPTLVGLAKSLSSRDQLLPGAPMVVEVALRLVPDGGAVAPLFNSTLGEYAERGIYNWLSVSPASLRLVLTCLAVLLIAFHVGAAATAQNWNPHPYFSRLPFITVMLGMGLWAIHVLGEFGSPLDFPHNYLVLMTHTIAGNMASPDELAAVGMAIAFWFSELPAAWIGLRSNWKKREAASA